MLNINSAKASLTPEDRIPPGTLIHAQKSYQLVGACFQVYNELGCGFLEAVYQEALAPELAEQNVPFFAQPNLKIHLF